MRIAHVIPTYVPAFRYGGPIRSVYGLAEAQASAGDTAAVFTTDVDGDKRLAVPLGRAVTVGRHAARYFAVVPPRRLARSPALRAALERELPATDVVHLHSVFLWPSWSAARAARRARRPYVVSPRGMLDAHLIAGRGALRKRLWIALVERRTLAQAARIVATSELEAQAIRRLGLELAKIEVVPNGVDLQELAAPPAEAVTEAIRATAAGAPFVLFLGRLSWKKRIDVLIEALAHLEGVRLVVAGVDDEGIRPRLEELARAAGVAERVEFVGEVTGANRVSLLRGAMALGLSSTAENFGNAVLEAMACGVPVVVSPGVGLAAEVERTGCGKVVVGGPEAFAAALRELVSDPEAARAAGQLGRLAVESRYTWRAVAARMRAVYLDAGAA